MFIETSKYAAPWMVDVAHDIKPVFTAVGVFRIYDVDEEISKKFPLLRDRSEDYMRMVVGLATGKGSDFTECLNVCHTRVYTGSQLNDFGWDPEGAQFSQKYLVVVV